MSDPCDTMDCSLPGSSVHRIFQVRILEWVAISFSQPEDSSLPRDQTHTSCLTGRFFTAEPPGKPSYWNWTIPVIEVLEIIPVIEVLEIKPVVEILEIMVLKNKNKKKTRSLLYLNKLQKIYKWTNDIERIIDFFSPKLRNFYLVKI